MKKQIYVVKPNFFNKEILTKEVGLDLSDPENYSFGNLFRVDIDKENFLMVSSSNLFSATEVDLFIKNLTYEDVLFGEAFCVEESILQEVILKYKEAAKNLVERKVATKKLDLKIVETKDFENKLLEEFNSLFNVISRELTEDFNNQFDRNSVYPEVTVMLNDCRLSSKSNMLLLSENGLFNSISLNSFEDRVSYEGHELMGYKHQDPSVDLFFVKFFICVNYLENSVVLSQEIQEVFLNTLNSFIKNGMIWLDKQWLIKTS